MPFGYSFGCSTVIRRVSWLVIKVVVLIINNFFFKRYKVYNVSPNTKSQAGALNTWLDVEGVDFWDSPRSAAQNGRVMIAPTVLARFEEFLLESGVNYQLIIENVEM